MSLGIDVIGQLNVRVIGLTMTLDKLMILLGSSRILKKKKV